MLTLEQEIEALRHARGEVLRGRMFICNHLNNWAAYYACNVFKARALTEEVAELLDYKGTVETTLFSEHVEPGNSYCRDWMRLTTTQSEVAMKYRLAIIDVLLARRGVK